MITATAGAAMRASDEQVGSDLRVSSNGRYLVDQDGTPFFWAGDTGWAMFAKLTPGEADQYLTDRAAKGFTVIQAGIITWYGNIPNANGDPPFTGQDVSQPNEAFFRNVDAIIDDAARNRLHIGLLPVFLGQQSGKWLVDRTIAYGYGQWLGSRYKSKPNVIWILGGDIYADDESLLDVWRALARGIAVGVTGSEDYSKTVMTFHPGGCSDGTKCFQHDAWLSLNNNEVYDDYTRTYPVVAADYSLTPTKPTGIGESWYENAEGASPLVIRRSAYWAFLAGGYYTYGATPLYRFDPGWQDALNYPGAWQMAIWVSLLTSRPWWTYAPDQSIITAGAGSGAVLNAAAGSADGSSIIVYLSHPTIVAIDMSKITAGDTVQAQWFDPSNGQRIPIEGSFPNRGTLRFSPPNGWMDAVLLLDAATAP